MQPLHSRGSPTPSAGRKSEVAASPLSSQGPKRNCYATPSFSRVPNAKHREEVGSSCLTPALWGPKRGRYCYATPAFLGVPDTKRGRKSE